jgi:MFS family permease
VAAPYIQDHAGSQQGLWLGMFYTAIPFGTCVGYGFGAAVAASPLGWSAAFFLEAMLMAPLVAVCFALPLDIHGKRSGTDGEKGEHLLSEGSEGYEGARVSLLLPAVQPTMREEVAVCLRRPLFVWSTLGLRSPNTITTTTLQTQSAMYGGFRGLRADVSFTCQERSACARTRLTGSPCVCGYVPGTHRTQGGSSASRHSGRSLSWGLAISRARRSRRSSSAAPWPSPGYSARYRTLTLPCFGP